MNEFVFLCSKVEKIKIITEYRQKYFSCVLKVAQKIENRVSHRSSCWSFTSLYARKVEFVTVQIAIYAGVIKSVSVNNFFLNFYATRTFMKFDFVLVKDWKPM